MLIDSISTLTQIECVGTDLFEFLCSDSLPNVTELSFSGFESSAKFIDLMTRKLPNLKVFRVCSDTEEIECSLGLSICFRQWIGLTDIHLYDCNASDHDIELFCNFRELVKLRLDGVLRVAQYRILGKALRSTSIVSLELESILFSSSFYDLVESIVTQVQLKWMRIQFLIANFTDADSQLLMTAFRDNSHIFVPKSYCICVSDWGKDFRFINGVQS